MAEELVLHIGECQDQKRGFKESLKCYAQTLAPESSPAPERSILESMLLSQELGFSDGGMIWGPHFSTIAFCLLGRNGPFPAALCD